MDGRVQKKWRVYLGCFCWVLSAMYILLDIYSFSTKGRRKEYLFFIRQTMKRLIFQPHGDGAVDFLARNSPPRKQREFCCLAVRSDPRHPAACFAKQVSGSMLACSFPSAYNFTPTPPSFLLFFFSSPTLARRTGFLPSTSTVRPSPPSGTIPMMVSHPTTYARHSNGVVQPKVQPEGVNHRIGWVVSLFLPICDSRRAVPGGEGYGLHSFVWSMYEPGQLNFTSSLFIKVGLPTMTAVEQLCLALCTGWSS